MVASEKDANAKLTNLLEKFGNEQQKRSVLETEIKQFQVYNESKDIQIQELMLQVSEIRQQNHAVQTEESLTDGVIQSLSNDLKKELAQKEAMQLSLSALESKADFLQNELKKERDVHLVNLERLNGEYLSQRMNFSRGWRT